MEDPTPDINDVVSFTLDQPIQMATKPLFSANLPAGSYGTLDELVSISFSQPILSPRVTFEGLAGLQTLECRIDPIDQS